MNLKNETLSNVISLPEINNLQELAEGCNKAVVSYGLQERFGKPNQFKMCKMVILFCDADLEQETIVAASNITMMKHGVSLCKPFIYKVFDTLLKHVGTDFFASLFKPIFGFTPNENVHDNTKMYNEYRKGGFNG